MICVFGDRFSNHMDAQYDVAMHDNISSPPILFPSTTQPGQPNTAFMD